MVLNLSGYPQRDNATLQPLVGTPMYSARCAVVDKTNTVVNVIMADHQLYVDPSGNQVMPSASAQIGWTLSNGQLMTRLAVVVAGKVTQVINGDPTTAAVTAGSTIIASPTAQVGNTYNPKTGAFAASVATSSL